MLVKQKYCFVSSSSYSLCIVAQPLRSLDTSWRRRLAGLSQYIAIENPHFPSATSVSKLEYYLAQRDHILTLIG
jgi:hypothetical protein